MLELRLGLVMQCIKKIQITDSKTERKGNQDGWRMLKIIQ